MYARAALPVGEQVLATLVPKDAIVLGGPQPMVVVINGATTTGQTGTPAPTPVQLGVAYQDWIQVTGGLKPGQLVVAQGNERIRPGQQVTVSRIMNAPAESPSTATSSASVR
jgi:multidrug efflux system membrane fusion protein